MAQSAPVPAASSAAPPPPLPANPNDPYAPLGVPLGGFLLFPDVKLGETYDSNIFRRNTGEVSDFITTIEPELALKSNWNNHALNFYGAGKLGYYASHDTENYNDYTFGTDGRLDILRDSTLDGSLQYTKGHEDRGSPDSPTNAKEPADTTTMAAKAAFNQQFNRFKLTPSIGWTNYNYDDVTAINGANINNDDRDNTLMQYGMRGSYNVMPSFDVFAEGIYNTIDYDAARDDNGFNRDSSGWEARTGVSMLLTNLITGDFYVGYLSQNMDDARFKDINGVSFGSSLKWEITRLTTLGLNAARTVQQTTAGNASGVLQSAIEATVHHELLRNLLLDGALQYTDDDYQGINRTDTIYEASAGATYKLNRWAGVGASYKFARRDSDVTGADYDDHQMMLNLLLQY